MANDVGQLSSRLNHVLRIGLDHQKQGSTAGTAVHSDTVAKKKFVFATKVAVFPHAQHMVDVDIGAFLEHLSVPLTAIDAFGDVYGSNERADAGPVGPAELLDYWAANKEKIPLALRPKTRRSIAVEMTEGVVSNQLFEHFKEPGYMVSEEGKGELKALIDNGPVHFLEKLPLTRMTINEWLINIYSRLYFLPMGRARDEALWVMRQLTQQWIESGPSNDAVEYALMYNNEMHNEITKLMNWPQNVGIPDKQQQLKIHRDFASSNAHTMLSGALESADQTISDIYEWFKTLYDWFGLIDDTNMIAEKTHLLEVLHLMDAHAKASIFRTQMLTHWVKFIKGDLIVRIDEWIARCEKDLEEYYKALEEDRKVYKMVGPTPMISQEDWDMKNDGEKRAYLESREQGNSNDRKEEFRRANLYVQFKPKQQKKKWNWQAPRNTPGGGDGERRRNQERMDNELDLVDPSLARTRSDTRWERQQGLRDEYKRQ